MLSVKLHFYGSDDGEYLNIFLAATEMYCTRKNSFINLIAEALHERCADNEPTDPSKHACDVKLLSKTKEFTKKCDCAVTAAYSSPTKVQDSVSCLRGRALCE